MESGHALLYLACDLPDFAIELIYFIVHFGISAADEGLKPSMGCCRFRLFGIRHIRRAMFSNLMNVYPLQNKAGTIKF